jgi:hypothetical protein
VKGIVFNEFIELVESEFGLDVVDSIIDESHLPHKGAYTGVGTYDHSEMISLVQSLSKKTQVPADELMRVFGEHLLLNVFSKKFPFFFKDKNLFTFLKSIDEIIHVEVKKLYADADLPTIKFNELNQKHAILIYKSQKPFADLAYGLIRGSAKYYKEKVDIVMSDKSAVSGTHREFSIKRSG